MGAKIGNAVEGVFDKLGKRFPGVDFSDMDICEVMKVCDEVAEESGVDSGMLLQEVEDQSL